MYKFCRESCMRSIAVLVLLMFSLTWAQSDGQIVGSVVDSQTGEPLIGANIYLEGTTLGAASDLDGRYLILNVPEGGYTLVVSIVGYAEMKVSDVQVEAGEVTKLDIPVQPEILTTDVVVVEAKALENTEAALLKSRQKAEAVSDAISAEEISKSGSGDAAAAMKKVTGASVVGGKYVYIRGLGERYSATTLNGAELPSADPDKKSFQLDLIPSNMLENITTIKTFTPDKPGTFTGGLVDVSLRSYPEELTLQVQSSLGYNSQTTGNSNFILANSGGTDWLGIDDGTRALPGIVKELGAGDVSVSRGMTTEEALYIDKMSKAFSKDMLPVSANAPINSSFGLSVGNTNYLGENKNQSIGYFGSISWGQKYSFIDNGKVGRYKLVGSFNDVEALVPEFEGEDSRGTREINWGSIANIAYKNDNIGQFKFSYMHTQSTESEGRTLVGFRATDRTSPGSTKGFSTNSVSWIERSLDTYQLDGKHQLPFVKNALLDWKMSASINEQIEPDRRFFFNVFIPQPDSTVIYQFDGANTLPTTRFFRDLTEDNYSTQINLSLPFKQWGGVTSKIKIGFASSEANREYNQRRFEYIQENIQLNDFADGYTVDYDSLFSSVGIIDSVSRPDRPDRWFRGGLFIDEAVDPTNFFRADMRTNAYYAMIELQVLNRLRFIGGTRLEATKVNSRTKNPEDIPGALDDTDFLPSVNLIYALRENMNLRTAFSRTLARPTFRELAPYESFDFQGDFVFRGNSNLERTLITNYDLRWEWFINPGELLAVSAFYKKFKDPIERKFVLVGGSGDDYKISVENVDKGRVYGMEFEVRKALDFIHDGLKDVKIGSNLSLVNAEVDIPEDDYQQKLFSGDSSASRTRAFPGQSPYLLNLNITYDNYRSATAVGIYYNIFGDRMFITGRDGTPDVIERGYGSLDAKATQGFGEKFSVSIAAMNLLNPAQEFSYTLKNDLVNKDFIYQSYKKGISYSFSINYKL